MHDLADTESLRQYAPGNSHDAFAALLSRHVNLVYFTALRKTGNPQAAEDVTPVVFILLARKARFAPEDHSAQLAVSHLTADGDELPSRCNPPRPTGTGAPHANPHANPCHRN
jgi:hypothetical protein